MTIRFTCQKCDSVLKIKDELSGTNAKCPKCKTPFRIPEPSAAAKKASPPKQSTKLASDGLENLVDMPREVTPAITFAHSDEFDAMSVLGGGPPANSAGPISDATEETPLKPSVAELMREHEEKMKEKNKRRGTKTKKGGLAEAAAAATEFTSGTAADAITRSYDQKRGKANEAPTMTREERREAEYKEGLKDFSIKAAAGLAGVLILGYFLISWAMSESMPDLEYVSGVVVLEGKPLSGVQVTFAPYATLDGTPLEVAGTSTGYTNAAGEFVLMYMPEYAGALQGKHRVSIAHPSGIVYTLPPELVEQSVDPDNENTFQLSF